jgi:hypothetical protein
MFTIFGHCESTILTPHMILGYYYPQFGRMSTIFGHSHVVCMRGVLKQFSHMERSYHHLVGVILDLNKKLTDSLLPFK